MEPDLKDTIKKLEEAKNKQEKIERIIILLSGLLVIVIFSIIGINIYTDREETVSEPEITIVSKEIKKTEPLAETKTQPVAPVKAVEVPATPEKEETIHKPENTTKAEKSATAQKTDTRTEKAKENKKPAESKKSDRKTEKPAFVHGFYIQIGAFSSRKKAEKLVKDLQIKNAFIRKEGELYKVMIGSFKNKKEAYNFMKSNKIKGFIRKL